MINWFGPEAWAAPLCRECPRCDTPIDTACERCGVAITATDRGVTIPLIGVEARGAVAYHLACHLKSVLPHAQWVHFGLTPGPADGFVALDDGARLRCPTCRAEYWPREDRWVL